MKVSLLYEPLKMKPTASKSNPKLLVTKSGIPLLSNRKEVPKEYSQDFSLKSKTPEEKADPLDEKEISDREAALGPKFILNATPFVYGPRMVITDKGELKVQKGITWLQGEETIATPETTIPRMEKNVSLLTNILYFNDKNKDATPSEVDPTITFPIVKEWVRQLMAARSICCYEDDIEILLHNKSKLEIVQDEFNESPILKFELFTEKKLLPRGERLVNGYFMQYDKEKFTALTKGEIDSALYILVIMDGIMYSLNYIIDNYHVRSYVPVSNASKNILDQKLTHFWTSKNFKYVPAKERELEEEESRFLPLLSETILQEDYCLLFLRDMHLHPYKYEDESESEDDSKFVLTKAMYISYYTDLITQALKLEKEA